MHAPGPRRVVPKSQYGGGVQVLTEDTIGLPIYYPDGPYKGKTILTLIEEVQKPDLGRKYGQRDSRPLDPPPVVQVRLYEIFDYGTPGERRVELDVSVGETAVKGRAQACDVFMPGLICYAELFPYNADFEYDPRIYPDGRPPPTPIQPTGAPDAGRPLACANTYPPDNLPRQPRIPLTRDAALPLQLHGERHQNVILVPDIRGSAKKVLYFVFSELQVRLTGHFMLKYTAIHVDHTVAPAGKAPLMAECWGGVFAVYPSKQHPALRQSTELTNHLSRCGSKLHSRHKQRVGRGSVARLDGGTASPPTPKPTLPSVKRLPSENQNGTVRKRKQKQQTEKNGAKKRPRKENGSDSEDEEDELQPESGDDEDDYRPAARKPSEAAASENGNTATGAGAGYAGMRAPHAPPPRSAGSSRSAASRERSATVDDDDHAAGLLLLGIGQREREREELQAQFRKPYSPNEYHRKGPNDVSPYMRRPYTPPTPFRPPTPPTPSTSFRHGHSNGNGNSYGPSTSAFAARSAHRAQEPPPPPPPRSYHNVAAGGSD